MRILNLYAGIGGNRKLWGDEHEVTAVEIDPKIAEIYCKFFPNDEVIVGDAHQYLLEHYKEFDFIWSSPPCPTHSRMRLLKKEQGAKEVYPDMKLYQEIIFLDCWFKGKWCVENVITYYDPIISAQESNNHYFWCNFQIDNKQKEKRGLIRTTMLGRIKYMEKDLDIDLSDVEMTKTLKSKTLSNCVKPELAADIFKMAFKERQVTLA